MNTVSLPHDHHARDDASDPRFNVTLEASAGTGKTRVLVNRYIRLIAAGAAPRNILAITFTRKAASEMKHRIIEELHQHRPLWNSVRDRLFDVHIVTMDAFCLGLLKEFPLEANLEPDTDLLDGIEIHFLHEASIEHSLRAHGLPPTPDLEFLMAQFGEMRLRQGIRHFLRSRLVAGPLLDRFTRHRIPHPVELRRTLHTASTNVRTALRDHYVTTLPASMRHIIDTDPGTLTRFDLEHIASYFLTQKGNPRRRLSGACRPADFNSRAQYDHHREHVIEAAPVIAEHIRRWRRDVDQYAVQELWKLYQSATRHFTLMKKERNGLDFSDVILYAVTLLNERSIFAQSRFRLESRYHHLLIDEFQDTNEMQWSLIQSLIDSWGEGAGLVQDAITNARTSGTGHTTLQEPSLFLVGDRKQSVYGWRDARVEVMDTANTYLMNIRPHGGRQLYLRQSFRSRPAVLGFLNDLFSGVPKAKEDVSWAFRYRHSDRFPVIEDDDHDPPAGLAIAVTRADAAAAVGDDIVRLLQEHDYRPKDIAICFRSRTHYRVYETALAQREVPTYVHRGLGFYDSPEVRDIRAVIRYLAHPISELRAAEILRSRFIGLSDTGLSVIANHRRRGRTASLVQMLRRPIPHNQLPDSLTAADQTIIGQTLPRLAAWRSMTDRIPPSDLLQRIIEETDYAAHFTGRGGIQGWENLKKVLELLRRAQNRGYMTFGHLAEYLDYSSQDDESFAALETVDAVSLMTIHAAKGLEFRAVFVVNMDQALRTDTSLPRIKEHVDGTVDIHAMEAIEPEGPDRVLEEEKRLLYVALTRAKHYLVLSSLDASRTGHHATFNNLLPKSLRELLPQALTVEGPELHWKTAGNEHRLRIVRPASYLRQHRNTTAPPSQRLAMQPLQRPARSRTSVSQLVAEPSASQAMQPGKAAVGKTVHRLLEYEVAPDEALEKVADALLPDDPEHTADDRNRAVHTAVSLYRQLHHHAPMNTLFRDGTLAHEVPFVFTNDEQTIRGTIDSLVLQHDRVTVVEYKTGAPSTTHRRQMEYYLQATRALFPHHDVEGLIVYPMAPPQRFPS